MKLSPGRDRETFKKIWRDYFKKIWRDYFKGGWVPTGSRFSWLFAKPIKSCVVLLFPWLFAKQIKNCVVMLFFPSCHRWPEGTPSSKIHFKINQALWIFLISHHLPMLLLPTLRGPCFIFDLFMVYLHFINILTLANLH